MADLIRNEGGFWVPDSTLALRAPVGPVIASQSWVIKEAAKGVNSITAAGALIEWTGLEQVWAESQPLLYTYNAANFPMSSGAPQFILISTMVTNTVAPGRTIKSELFTLGQIDVEAAGAKAIITKSSSTAGKIQAVTPGVTQMVQTVGNTPFSLTSGNAYFFGLTLSGATAASSLVFGTTSLVLVRS